MEKNAHATEITAGECTCTQTQDNAWVQDSAQVQYDRHFLNWVVYKRKELLKSVRVEDQLFRAITMARQGTPTPPLQGHPVIWQPTHGSWGPSWILWLRPFGMNFTGSFHGKGGISWLPDRIASPKPPAFSAMVPAASTPTESCTGKQVGSYDPINCYNSGCVCKQIYHRFKQVNLPYIPGPRACSIPIINLSQSRYMQMSWEPLVCMLISLCLLDISPMAENHSRV